jgi:hypothetical protein
MLPKKFFRVVLRRGQGRVLRMYQKGGGTYVREADARAQLASLRNRGVECDLYVSEPVVWKLVESDER